MNVDAHKTVVGRVFFPLKHALLKGCTVDEYEVIATDSHGSTDIYRGGVSAGDRQ